jgi:hypothetical protein
VAGVVVPPVLVPVAEAGPVQPVDADLGEAAGRPDRVPAARDETDRTVDLLDRRRRLADRRRELDRRARLGAGDPDGDRFVGSAPGRRVDCQVVAVGR